MPIGDCLNFQPLVTLIAGLLLQVCIVSKKLLTGVIIISCSLLLIWLQKTPRVDVDKALWQVDTDNMQTPQSAQNGGWAAQQNQAKRDAPYTHQFN